MTKAMSTRIISATVAIILAVIVLILHKTFIFDIAVGCLAVGAVYELFKAMDYLKFRVQSWICMGYAFLTCVSYMWWQNGKCDGVNLSGSPTEVNGLTSLWVRVPCSPPKITDLPLGRSVVFCVDISKGFEPPRRRRT